MGVFEQTGITLANASFVLIYKWTYDTLAIASSLKGIEMSIGLALSAQPIGTSHSVWSSQSQ
jgi:hypothetical protein